MYIFMKTCRLHLFFVLTNQLHFIYGYRNLGLKELISFFQRQRADIYNTNTSIINIALVSYSRMVVYVCTHSNSYQIGKLQLEFI